MRGRQRLMRGRRRHTLLHRLQQPRLRLVTMGIAPQLLVYTLPRHPRHTRLLRQGLLEPRHLGPTVLQHLLLAKPRRRTRISTDLGVRSMRSVCIIGPTLLIACR